MKALRQHRGKLVSLDRSNIDTDQIIAKQFLKSISRTGFGPHLFHDWRFDANEKPVADFPLNQSRFQGASILVAGNNFGCGSSREHAVWAVKEFGFEVVVAPKNKQKDGSFIPAFADIFRNNSSKNGLLTIELSDVEVGQIHELVVEHPGLEATADVETETLKIHAPGSETIYRFEMDPAVKERFLHGLDDIGRTLREEAANAAFEKTHDTQLG